jgi:hypothetical protein
MNRNIAFLIILIFSISALHSEAPELKNVMPNSWRKVTRLTANEEQTFFRGNQDLLDRILTQWQEWGRSFAMDISNTRIYREQIGADTFYR